MAISYEWDCKTHDRYPTHNSKTNVVYNVHWRLTATDDSNNDSEGHPQTATVYGTQSLDTSDLSSYKNFELFAITDTDFMNIYHHYSPYCFVHFDGPHMTRDVLTEAIWFANRAGTNCRFVFDDYPKYDMPLIQAALVPFGFKKFEAGKNKICLEKRRSDS